jgi:hypothetical protein
MWWMQEWLHRPRDIHMCSRANHRPQLAVWVVWLVGFTWSKNHQEHTSVKNCHPWSWTWGRCQDGMRCRYVVVHVLLVYDVEKYFSLQKFVLNTWWISVFASYLTWNHIEYKTRHTKNYVCLVILQCSLKMIVCKYVQVRDTRSECLSHIILYSLSPMYCIFL